MTGIEIFQGIVGSGGLLAILLVVFRTGKIIQKIENIESNLEEFESTTDRNFECLTDEIRDIEHRLSKIETRIEERTLKVIYTTKQLEEKA